MQQKYFCFDTCPTTSLMLWETFSPPEWPKIYYMLLREIGEKSCPKIHLHLYKGPYKERDGRNVNATLVSSLHNCEVRNKMNVFFLENELRRLCFYTRLSVHGGRGGLPLHAGIPPLPPQTSTIADGTHPTGMHSCWNELFLLQLDI